MKNICQTNDPVHAHLVKVINKYPEVVKVAADATIDETYFSNLPDYAYAMPETRQYPINNKEQTILSIGYAKVASESLPKQVIHALEKAAELFDIDMDKLFNKTASEDVCTVKETYLLPDIKRFKVASKSDVPIMEEGYLNKYAQLTTAQKLEAGDNLVKIANEYGVSLKPKTYKLAGYTATNNSILKDWTEARKQAADTLKSPTSETYTKIAQEINKLPTYLCDKNNQLELVELISNVDKIAGVDQLYGNVLLDPVQSVFNTDKVLRDYVKVGSSAVNKQILSKIPLDFWEDVLGSAGVKEVAPGGEVNPELLSQVIDTLPVDLRTVVEKQLAAYNK